MDCTHAWLDKEIPLLQEIKTSKSEIDFEIYIDRGSVELFADGGKVAITNLIMVETALTQVTSHGAIQGLEILNFA